jgi:hypothetical protein
MTLLDFAALFPEFSAPSWDGWRAVLARLTDAVREFYAAVGRGAGKSRIVALLACYFATREHARRAPGERLYVAVIAPDRRQAAITHRYILGLLQSVPALAALIVNVTRDSIELSNGVVIEVVTANLVAPRGRSYALVIVEEAAFLPTDESANPDVEIIRAVRPALARVAGSLLAVVSSPYARRGVLWSASQREPDSSVLFVQAPTRELNPTFDRAAIDKAYAEDPVAAASEYGAQFRSDLESYISREAIARVVVAGRTELAPRPADGDYLGFADPAGGSGGDSFTLAIAHGERDEDDEDGAAVAVLDLVREIKPPFSPAAVVAEFSALLRAYGCTRVVGDRYAGEWPREAFRRHGIEYVLSDRTRSELYRDLLPLINSGAVELLDHPRLISQLHGLERRAGPSGRDAIDHASRGHDDLINAVAGVLVLVSEAAGQPVVRIT